LKLQNYSEATAFCKDVYHTGVNAQKHNVQESCLQTCAATGIYVQSMRFVENPLLLTTAFHGMEKLMALRRAGIVEAQ